MNAITQFKPDVLLLVRPRDLDPLLVNGLDKLFKNGTPVVIFGSTVTIGDNLSAEAYSTGLDDWLKDKGIDFNPQLIIDPKYHTSATFFTGAIQYNIPYPFFVQVNKQGLHSKNAITAKLENIVFPWTNSLTIDPDVHKDWSYEILAESSSATLVQKGDPDVDPVALESFEMSPGEKKTLAVLVTAPSSIKDKESRLLVVSNAHFIQDNFVRDHEVNLVFVQNMLDWLTWGNELIGIRSRGKTNRPLELPSSTRISFIRFSHMIGIPLIVILVGLGFAFMRKRRRLKIRDELLGSEL